MSLLLTFIVTFMSLIMIAGSENIGTANLIKNRPLPDPNKAARALSRSELLPLESIARRAQSMMSIATFTATKVWPHGVRDQQGRLGIFLSSGRPLFNDSTPAVVNAKEIWAVLALLAAVKYSEGSEVGHIAFTDCNGETGERWYYDICMDDARRIQLMLLHGDVRHEEAFKLMELSWQKVTAEHHLAIR